MFTDKRLTTYHNKLLIVENYYSDLLYPLFSFFFDCNRYNLMVAEVLLLS